MTLAIGSRRCLRLSGRQLLTLIAFASLLHADQAKSQTATPEHAVVRGDSVRLWGGAPLNLEGTPAVVERFTNDSLIVASGVGVNLLHLSRLEVRRTVMSRSVVRSGAGLLGGLVLGVLALGVIGQAAPASADYGAAGALAAIPVAATVGAVAGARLGARKRQEVKWISVPLPR